MRKKPKFKIENPMVAEVFFNYPATIRERLLILRELVLSTAKKMQGVGNLEETLKWGEPSYLTTETKAGSTIRMHTVKNQPNKYALYFNCKTNLIESFREKYPTKLKFSGNRAILFDLKEEIPIEIVRDCITSALTYNLKGTKKL